MVTDLTLWCERKKAIIQSSRQEMSGRCTHHIHTRRILKVVPSPKLSLNSELSKQEGFPGFPTLITSCLKQWHNQQGVNRISSHILGRRTRCTEHPTELQTSHSLSALWRSIYKHTALQSRTYCFRGKEETKTRKEITLTSRFTRMMLLLSLQRGQLLVLFIVQLKGRKGVN